MVIRYLAVNQSMMADHYLPVDQSMMGAITWP